MNTSAATATVTVGTLVTVKGSKIVRRVQRIDAPDAFNPTLYSLSANVATGKGSSELKPLEAIKAVSA